MIESRIKEIAASKGIRSSYGLQKALGIAPSNALRLWDGKVTRFSVEILDKLCETFGVSVGDLLVYRKGENDTENVIQNKDSISANTSNVVEMPVNVPANSRHQLDQSETEKLASTPGTPQTTASGKDLMTVADVMSYLSKSESSVLRYIKKYGLEAKKVGGGWKILRKDVEAFEKSDFYINEAKK